MCTHDSRLLLFLVPGGVSVPGQQMAAELADIVPNLQAERNGKGRSASNRRYLVRRPPYHPVDTPGGTEAW